MNKCKLFFLGTMAFLSSCKQQPNEPMATSSAEPDTVVVTNDVLCDMTHEYDKFDNSIKPGDTIVVRGDTVIKNLSRERLKSDTVVVTNTNDLYTHVRAYKIAEFTDKNGVTNDVLCDMTHEYDEFDNSIKPGDTIVVRGDTFIKNLSRERLKSESVKGR